MQTILKLDVYKRQVCTKILINAGIERIVYANPYPDKLAEEMLKAANMKVTILHDED